MKFFTTLLFFCLTLQFSVFSQELVSSAFLGSKSKADLTAEFGINIFKNGVDYYKLTYTTLDVHGVQDTASGLLAIPDVLSKVYPLLVYQHGTVASKDNVPSNLEADWEITVIYAGVGYVSLTPDYLGLGESRGFHPYMHAASEASAAVDMMRAAKEFAANNDVFINEQVFVSGYSQGGHAAMALFRELETNLSDEFEVTAATPMSGPYSISGVMRDLILREEEYFTPSYLPNTMLSYQTVYDNIFNNLEDLFKPAYVPAIDDYFNGTIDLLDLNTQLIDKLIENEGASIPIFMFQDDVINSVKNDPNDPINVDLRDNDVFDWTPQAPTRMYYCGADEQVPFENSILADSVMNANGAPDVGAFNLNPNASHFGCVLPAISTGIFFFSIFQRIDQATATVETSAPAPFQIFPNPVQNNLFVKEIPAEGELLLYDLNGRTYSSLHLQKGDNELDVAALPTGLYIAEIRTGGAIWHRKIIVGN